MTAKHLAFAVLFFAFIACSDGNTITYANKTYKTVKIGEQVWFAENLNYDAEGSKCYDNNPDNCTKYGRLYNWKTAMTVCPDGWRLPSDEDWDKLLRFAYDNADAKNPYYSPTAGKFLKAASGWDNNKGKGNGTDDFGFSALPGGACNSDSNSDCDFIGYRGLWWSATEGSVGYYAYYRDLDYYGQYNTADSISRQFSVRCMKDSDAGQSSSSTHKCGGVEYAPATQYCSEGTIKDYGLVTYGGQTYKTVKIGKQTWMAENLNYEAEGSVCYENNPDNCTKYGRLYTLETAKKICPKGWHLPHIEEWDELHSFVNDDIGRLKAVSGWNEDGNGTDDFGFSALPGGEGDLDGSFDLVGDVSRWWSSCEGMTYCSEFSDMIKSFLQSVRCLQD